MLDLQVHHEWKMAGLNSDDQGEQEIAFIEIVITDGSHKDTASVNLHLHRSRK